MLNIYFLKLIACTKISDFAKNIALIELIANTEINDYIRQRQQLFFVQTGYNIYEVSLYFWTKGGKLAWCK